MEKLKDSIRYQAASGQCTLKENYQNSQELGSLLLADLKKAIEDDFPMLPYVIYSLCTYHVFIFAYRPDQIDAKGTEHLNYAIQKSLAYVPQQSYLDVLNSVQEPSPRGKLLIVLGASGSGKSSLLSHWWRTQQYSISTFVHFIGASSFASDFPAMIQRLFKEVNTIHTPHGSDSSLTIPTTEQELIAKIPEFLNIASAKVIKMLQTKDTSEISN